MAMPTATAMSAWALRCRMQVLVETGLSVQMDSGFYAAP